VVVGLKMPQSWLRGSLLCSKPDHIEKQKAGHRGARLKGNSLEGGQRLELLATMCMAEARPTVS